jgi:hypothetical protein
MSHDHGSEYQIKVVHEDGAEEASEWVTSEEQVVEMVASAYRQHGRAYWLRERTVLCPDCPVKEHRIEEYLVANVGSLHDAEGRRHAV